MGRKSARRRGAEKALDKRRKGDDGRFIPLEREEEDFSLLGKHFCESILQLEKIVDERLCMYLL